MRSKLSEFIPLVVAAAIVLVAAACGGDGEEKSAAQGAAKASPTTEPGASAFPPASDPVPEEIVTAARKFLADELDAAEGDVTLVSSEGMGWSDASLGCPKEGYAYAQVLTTGYKLVFDLAGTSHAVHTNADGSHMVVCGDGQ